MNLIKRLIKKTYLILTIIILNIAFASAAVHTEWKNGDFHAWSDPAAQCDGKHYNPQKVYPNVGCDGNKLVSGSRCFYGAYHLDNWADPGQWTCGPNGNEYCSDNVRCHYYVNGCERNVIRDCGSNYKCIEENPGSAWCKKITKPECTPGEKETRSCGYGGKQTRVCQSNSKWGDWGSCTGEGECFPKTVETRSCGTSTGVCTIGTQKRTCGSNYYWGSWGSCSGVSPSKEICDGLDNDCDGTTDEGGVCDPKISNLPDKAIKEDSGLNNNIIDLHKYVTDVDNSPASLTYSIISQTNTGIVNCVVDNNRYIDCTTKPDKNGVSDITVKVSDGKGSDTDTFRVTVLDVGESPVVKITHPDSNHKNFVVGFDVNLMASVTDPDSSSLTYNINWGDSSSDNGNVNNNMVNKRHAYSKEGDYKIQLSASDGEFTGSDSVDVKIWPYAFNILNLMSYNDSDFTNADKTFYRNEPLYLKFKVAQKDAGFLVPDMINYVYIYNRDNPSNIYDLIGYNGNANGITIVNGQPSSKDGSYYYYMKNLPLSDDILGWNIVFVFSHNGTHAGQAELEIEVLNNPIELSVNFPDVVLDKTNGTHIYKDVNLNDYVSDVETPDSEIKWTFTGMVNVLVNILKGNIARFYAPISWQGVDNLIATADDNDGSKASRNFKVSSGVPSVTLLKPNCGDVVYGIVPVTWTANDPQSEELIISLEYSPDNGASWYPMASNLANTGSYSWNTLGLEQGKEYLVKVTATDSSGLFMSDVSSCPFTLLSGPDTGLSVKIIADKTKGEVPLEIQFDLEITGGNAPFTYAWDFNEDGVIDSTEKSPKAMFTKSDEYVVKVTVIDFDGDKSSATIIINAQKASTVLPRKKLHINTIRMLDEAVRPGEELFVLVNFENQGNYKIKDSSVTVFVPELNLRGKQGHIDLGTDEHASKTFVFEIPKDTIPGTYDVLVTIYDNGLKRKKYRPFKVCSEEEAFC